MISQPLRAFFLAWVLIGMVLFQSGRAQGDTRGASPSYVLVPKSAKRIKAGLTIEVKAPKVQADEWSVYVARLPELPGQIDVRTTLSPRGKPARELSDEGRPMLFARIPSVGQQWRQDVTTRVECEATLLERRLDRWEPGAPDTPAVAPLDNKTRHLGLANGHQFDYQSAPFRAWLKEHGLRREPMENEVDFARRAFAAMRKALSHYEGADVEHMASKVCEAGKSDFAGLTVAYVAVLRANGIPARSLCGFPVIFEGRPSTTYFPHAKAEFYAKGVGWVPADLAGAIRMNSPGEGLDFFGNDRADFLTTHVDTDLIIDTYFGRKTLQWLPDASWWVTGSGSLDGSRTKVTVTVEVESLDLTEALARKPASLGSKKQAAKPPR